MSSTLTGNPPLRVGLEKKRSEQYGQQGRNEEACYQMYRGR